MSSVGEATSASRVRVVTQLSDEMELVVYRIEEPTDELADAYADAAVQLHELVAGPVTPPDHLAAWFELRADLHRAALATHRHFPAH